MAVVSRPLPYVLESWIRRLDMTGTVTVIDYGSGNLRSVQKALERAAREIDLNADIQLSDDPVRISRSDRLVLPGVGAFSACKEGLLACDGVLDAMTDHVHAHGRPFLGVCVGMQLLASRGHEFGVHEGLGWVPGDVRRFDAEMELPVPHMGWQEVTWDPSHEAWSRPGLAYIRTSEYYFLHSFHFVPETPAHCLAECRYGRPFCAAVGRDNILGVQFHPEKSQSAGISLLKRFLTWSP